VLELEVIGVNYMQTPVSPLPLVAAIVLNTVTSLDHTGVSQGMWFSRAGGSGPWFEIAKAGRFDPVLATFFKETGCSGLVEIMEANESRGPETPGALHWIEGMGQPLLTAFRALGYDHCVVLRMSDNKGHDTRRRAAVATFERLLTQAFEIQGQWHGYEQSQLLFEAARRLVHNVSDLESIVTDILFRYCNLWAAEAAFFVGPGASDRGAIVAQGHSKWNSEHRDTIKALSLCASTVYSKGKLIETWQDRTTVQGVHYCYVAAPVEGNGERLGCLISFKMEPCHYPPWEMTLLTRLADIFGSGLIHYERQLKDMACTVMDERRRLKREVHDGIAQVMAYLITRTDVIEDLLIGGQLARARSELKEVREALREGYTDLRECLFHLRVPYVIDKGFETAVRECCARLQTYYGLKVKVKVDIDPGREVPPEAGVQLLRIIQEALTNVSKHAGVDEAQVKISCGPAGAMIEIADEGVGFDQSRSARGRPVSGFGLNCMRERAEALSGTVCIESTPGVGTRIRLQFPLATWRGGVKECRA